MKKIDLVELSKPQMEKVKAGCIPIGDWADCWEEGFDIVCGCGCYYADSGGSSIEDNRDANGGNNAFSPLKAPYLDDIPAN